MDPIYQPYSAWFLPVKFTASGRPEFLPEEIELLSSTRTNYYEGHNKRIEFQHAVITSQRFIYIHTEKSKSFSFPLRHCRSIEKHSPWFKTPRILFHLRDISQDKEIKSPSDIDESLNKEPSQVTPTFFSIGIKHSSTYNQLYDYARTALTDTYTAWKQQISQPAKATVDLGCSDNRAQNVGVGGILRRREEQQRQQTSTLNEAMNDLDSLMKSAQQVTVVLEKLSAKAQQQQLKQQQQQQQTSPTQDGPTTDDDNTGDIGDLDIQRMLHTMGFISPVTKATSGVQYQEQLSRQLFDFCMTLFQTYNSTIVLTDLFCLYNKARGTDLISPVDLLQACQLWSELGLNIKFKQLSSSATYVVQSPEYDEDKEQFRIFLLILQHYYDHSDPQYDKLAELDSYSDVEQFITQLKSASNPPSLAKIWKSTQSLSFQGITPLEISQQLKISLQLVREYLGQLETQGHVIRDTTHQSIYYYCNIIPYF